MTIVASPSPNRIRLPAAVREQRILDVAADLFYRRGVHDVGMDELVKATGLGKASVYRVFASKDALITAYLARRAETIFGMIDADVAHHEGDPRGAIVAIIDAVEADLAGPSFRGCAFNNASIEFGDPANGARTVAREYREALRDRLINLATILCAGAEGQQLGEEIALIIEGMYLSAAHLGSSGPARRGRALVMRLLTEADHVR
jgi:AcrR family transcriptional regulator